MVQVVSAPPRIDSTAFARAKAEREGLRLVSDPTPGFCREHGYQTLYDIPAPFRLQVREKLLRSHLQELEALSGENILLDYSAFGWMADWMRWAWGETSTELWEEITAVMVKIASYYTQIHHLEAGARRGYDGYAWLDARNSRQIDALLRHLYAEFGVTDRVRITDG